MQNLFFCISDLYPSKTPHFQLPRALGLSKPNSTCNFTQDTPTFTPYDQIFHLPPGVQKSVSLLFTFSSHPTPHVQKLSIFGLPGPWGLQIWQLREILIAKHVYASSGDGFLTSFQRIPKFHHFGGGPQFPPRARKGHPGRSLLFKPLLAISESGVLSACPLDSAPNVFHLGSVILAPPPPWILKPIWVIS